MRAGILLAFVPLASAFLNTEFSGAKKYGGTYHAVEPYTALIDQNYRPGCWLDPKVRFDSWKLAKDCDTPEEDPH